MIQGYPDIPSGFCILMPTAPNDKTASTAPSMWSVRPAPPLDAYIDRIWGMSCHAEAPVALPRILPGTGAEMFIHFGQAFSAVTDTGAIDVLPRNHLLCMRNGCLDLLPSSNLDFIAVRFKSGCILRFLDQSLGECFDHPLSLDDAMGHAGAVLMDRLHGVSGRDQRVALLEEWLKNRLQRRAWFDPRMAWATRELYYKSEGIQALADRMGMGRRQLERRFKAQEGLSPVAFRQLARFQRTAKTLLLDPTQPLIQTGLGFGFADQAHMTREFRAIAGRTPERLRDEMRARLTFYCRSSSHQRIETSSTA